ncbi:unnamed protein product [Oppiella nova]|uniref:Ig-like domain-containing protein n=1 Tax=Oppiella nova TaxID=334625 RepID=A0A7R9LLZ1_9ACAR|nr:unnamed protein product [Oppiella nova]CAG2164911.1 unnamed protein product [Oppiella nova]
MYSLLTLKLSKFVAKKYSQILALSVITLLLADICSALLKIKEMSVPRLVENGTEDSVVLDCVYSLDTIDDRNLVVKWFFNDDPEPIYQFIAEFGLRHASSRLQGRINLNYTVNNDPLIKYRALNLLRPTVDLSGRYQCHVQSLQSQDSKEGSMIIYATPKDIEFSYKAVTRKEFSAALRKHKTVHTATDITSDSYSNDEQHYSSSASELLCKVSEVYPIPELTIYRVAQDGSSPRSLDIYRPVQSNQQTMSGAWNSSVSVYINDRDLIEKYGNEASIFECLVVFNEINHEMRKRIQYFPVNEELRNVSAESKVQFVFTIVSTIIYIYHCFRLNMNKLFC